jgi:hypothetical protein
MTDITYDKITCDICDRPTDHDDINTTEDGYRFCPDCGETPVRWLHDDRRGESYAYRY